jgi:hypothetical protein
LGTVFADSFDGTCIERFFTEGEFFRRLRLFVNVRVTVLVVAAKVRRRSVATDIAVDALRIDKELAGYIVWNLVFLESHRSLPPRRKDAENA